jgi:hypothetical protein
MISVAHPSTVFLFINAIVYLGSANIGKIAAIQSLSAAWRYDPVPGFVAWMCAAVIDRCRITGAAVSGNRGSGTRTVIVASVIGDWLCV